MGPGAWARPPRMTCAPTKVNGGPMPLKTLVEDRTSHFQRIESITQQFFRPTVSTFTCVHYLQLRKYWNMLEELTALLVLGNGSMSSLTGMSRSRHTFQYWIL